MHDIRHVWAGNSGCHGQDPVTEKAQGQAGVRPEVPARDSQGQPGQPVGQTPPLVVGTQHPPPGTHYLPTLHTHPVPTLPTPGTHPADSTADVNQDALTAECAGSGLGPVKTGTARPGTARARYSLRPGTA